MNLPSPLRVLTLAVLVTACATSPKPLPASKPGEPRYVVGFLSLRPTTPEAAEEARAQEARLLTALTELSRNTPIDVVRPTVAVPASLEQAPGLAREAKVDLLLWGDATVDAGKLTVKLSAFETLLSLPSSFWPMEYAAGDAKRPEALSLDALRLSQAVLQETLLPMMMLDQPANTRAVLDALVVNQTKDWVDWNMDIIQRRWGMLGRLLRDGALTEKGYRAALDSVLAWRKDHAATPSSDIKEAFYSVGLARGLLLQGKPQAVVDLLAPIVERMPRDLESRLLLGRALLALGRAKDAADTLEPLAREGTSIGATRIYVAAVTELPDGPSRATTALDTLVEKNPEDAMAHLLRHLTAPGTRDASALKAFTATHPGEDWPLPLARHLTGEAPTFGANPDEEEATDHGVRLRRIQLHYYLGEAALAGRLPGKAGVVDPTLARQHFEAALATHAFHHPTYDVADFQLEQLARAPSAETP
ncbi:tetratricopeptide repeat protein [Myxococcus sp. MISCRS1]|uniref:tetratricopeptide repeat protein n=1 Tax=Myxococcus sp. MISCRS1 TaxID=2996786 RepID=UPI0022713090|nr:tetratricopeptide repeat protein [Myxococcus sp. MISCRS1]MCY0999321.1 tetratricopeptide repeat protein [Myxococcus sp. MISCRS1]